MPVLISCDGHTVSTLRAVVTAGSPRPPFHSTGCWGLLLRMIHEWTRGEYTISTDPRRLDLDLIHDFLSRRSYWAAGRSRERVVCSIEHSLPFGLYHPSGQVGFARVVTDHVVIAFLADVFVLEAHRGRGLGKWLVETVVRAPELKRVRRWMLGTRDAHDLYRRFGFAEPAPGLLMEKIDPDSDRA